MEAAGLSLFMISAGVFATFFECPGSPARQAIANPWLRRSLMGLAMGLTAVAIIYSPWGKQSGAHINPAITLTFFRLGKIKPWDAYFYVVAQFAGALAGILLVALVLKSAIGHPSVRYVATVPGTHGRGIAFLAELVISFFLMFVVLLATNNARVARFTGLFAGVLVGI